MKGQKFRHVIKHNQQFTFQLNVLGFGLYPGEHWENEEDAACAADLTKHFFRTWYHIEKSMVPSLDPEAFSVLSYRLNVILSDRSSVEAALPPGVDKFLREHRDALDNFAEANRPERKPWDVMRYSPQFNSISVVRAWVLACEGAENDARCFGALNNEYLLTLVQGFANKFEDALAPLRAALRMHDKAPEGSARLEARKHSLAALIEHLEADLAYVSTLPDALRREQAEVDSALEKLQPLRPPLY